jgi:hypothetical protein
MKRYKTRFGFFVNNLDLSSPKPGWILRIDHDHVHVMLRIHRQLSLFLVTKPLRMKAFRRAKRCNMLVDVSEIARVSLEQSKPRHHTTPHGSKHWIWYVLIALHVQLQVRHKLYRKQSSPFDTPRG